MKYIGRFIAYIICVVVAASLWSCSDNEDPQPTMPAERTVLVYMVAANSLGIDYTSGGVYYHAADTLDIEEMTQAID